MIKVGIIGTGIIAREHAEGLAMTNGRLKLAAASDIDADRLAAFCDAFGVAGRFNDAQAMIADPGVDLVIVATPPSSHEQYAVAALEHGKYVMCEKPLAHSVASAKRIAEAAAKHPGKLAVGYQLRYYPPFTRLIWLVKNGWLGSVKSASVERHGAIPHDQHGATGWWGKWNVAGGGVLMTQLIHEMDLLVQIMGLPQAVTAVADTRFTKIESEDYLEASFRYADGSKVRCVASVNSGTVNGAFAITGEKGTAGPNRLDFLNDVHQAAAKAAVDSVHPLPKEPSNGRIARLFGKVLGRLGVRPKKAPTAHALFYLAIADAIDRKEPLPIPASEAMTSLELCMAVYESAITGREVSLPLPPDSKVFEGVKLDDYADRKCNRDKPAAAFVPPPRVPLRPHTKAQWVIYGIKYVLAHFGIETVHIKALLRKPHHVHGGPAARRWPWPRRRHIDEQERRAVSRLFKKEILFGDAVIYGGGQEDAYCQAFAKHLGGGYADAVNAGSNALYIALRALDLPPGSEVIVPPSTDAGGSMPPVVDLCVPIPADAAPGIVNTSVDQIQEVLTDRTSAIVVAHIGGHPVDMDPILELAAQRGIPVLEDCAQAHGASYKGRMLGTLGVASAFSTMFGKHHCTGGQGGVVFTRDPELFAKCKRIADRGKSFGVLGSSGNMVGTLNFNQDEVAMAIGLVQLAKLPGFVEARRKFANIVLNGLQNVDGVSLVEPPAGSESSYLFLLLKLDPGKLSCDSKGFATGLELEGIGGTYPGYNVHPTDFPWYTGAKVYGDTGIPWSMSQSKPKKFELPNARQSDRMIVRVDIHEGMRAREAQDLLTAIGKVARHYHVG